jgi:hypothetical protein
MEDTLSSIEDSGQEVKAKKDINRLRCAYRSTVVFLTA